MPKFKIVNVIDKVFISTCVFLLVYAWLNFFLRNLWISFVSSLIVSSAILFLLFYLLEKSKTKKAQKANKLNDIETSFLGFRLMSIPEKINYIKSISPIIKDSRTIDGSIVFSHEDKVHQIFIVTNEKALNEQTLFSIIERRVASAQKIILVCENSNPSLNLNLLNNLEIKVVDKFKFYDEFVSKSKAELPTSNLKLKTKKPLKILLANILIPPKAKQYFFCGLILIFSSLILPYKTYYLIFGSLFLVFAIISKLHPLLHNFFKRKN